MSSPKFSVGDTVKVIGSDANIYIVVKEIKDDIYTYDVYRNNMLHPSSKNMKYTISSFDDQCELISKLHKVLS